MTDNRDHVQEFESHTLLKHAVLRYYMERWARKLLLRPGAGNRLRFVDACAGRGKDDSGNPGSPLLAAVEAAKAQAQITELRGSPTTIEVVAIEQKASFFKDLQHCLKPFGANVTALRGTLGDFIGTFEKDFKDTPTLFFIDPFGLAPLQADVVRRALAGPRNEALMLFADQAALRHFGAVAAYERIVNPVQGSIFDLVDEPPPSDSVKKTKSAVETQAASATEILDAAFGNLDWRSAIEPLPKTERRKAFLTLYEQMLRSFGAEYVLPFPMLDMRRNLKYHLMYATKSVHGYKTIKDAVDRALKGADMMRFVVSCSERQVADQIRRRFAGKEVPWRGEEGEGAKEYALGYTPAFPSQLPEVKRLLKPYQQPGRKTVYSFPAIK